jgi:hypothetical protein
MSAGSSTRPRLWRGDKQALRSDYEDRGAQSPLRVLRQKRRGRELVEDFKLYIRADCLSCCRFIANQFRLLLDAATYWLMDTLRRKLVASGSRRMQLDTLRLSLIKIGGRVRELLPKVRLHLASGHPGQALWHAPSLAFGGVYE